jgi:4,5-dihydroxyphthalate decarboxylase
MAKPERTSLSIAIGDYDHTRDLVVGNVTPDGIDLVPEVLPVSEIFARFGETANWDIAEMSLGLYVNLLSRGEDWVQALPVFPSRTFRQSAVFVRREGNVRSPADLQGATIGFSDWTHTAGIYVRGWLQHDHGVDPTRVRWVRAGLERPGLHARGVLKLPDGMVHHEIADATLDEMLREGVIDAIVSAHVPRSAEGVDAPIVSLQPAEIAAEAAYYRRTGIFPIMHVVAVRRHLLESRPDLAASLAAAFEQAKQRALARLRDRLVSRLPLPWINVHAAAAEAEFGADFWPYGVTRNLPTLQAFLSYAHEQGVTHRPVGVGELFALDEVPA